jgi:hypothetical protein
LANPLWLAMTKDIDFSRPDEDEVQPHAAIHEVRRTACQKLVAKK